MQSFLNAQETLSKIRQYATIGHTTHTGEPLCVSTVESIYSALVLGCLHKSYAFIKAKYSGTGTGEKLPFPHELQDYVCSHYDTVISQEYSIVNTGAGIVDDRRRQQESKRTQLQKKVPCATCHRRGHGPKDCFITNEVKREEFLKRNPGVKDKVMKRVLEYKQQGKLPAPEQAAACPGVDNTGDVLFAAVEVEPDCGVTGCVTSGVTNCITSCVTSGVTNCVTNCVTGGVTGSGVTSDFTGVHLSQFEEVRHGVRGNSLYGGSPTPISFSPNQFSLLDDLQEAAPVAPVKGWHPLLHWFYNWRKLASRGRRRGLRSARSLRCSRRGAHLGGHSKPGARPVHLSFVYVDTLATVSQNTDYIEATQSIWEAGRVEHLGEGYVISPRQSWCSPDLQHRYSQAISFAVEMRDRGKTLLEALYPGCYVPGVLIYAGARVDMEATSLRAHIREMERILRGESVATILVMAMYHLVSTRVPVHILMWVLIVVVPTMRSLCLAWCLTLTRMMAVMWEMLAMVGLYLISLWSLTPTRMVVMTLCSACAVHNVQWGWAFTGKEALLDSGATRHIFCAVDAFGEDFDDSACSTFTVVQSQPVDSVGSGTVTLAKRDVATGKLVGLQLRGAHCIPGQPFNLVSVVALEDAGFLVDFGARQISSGGAVFSFSRVGKQYILHEDCGAALDTYMACAVHPDKTINRDRTNWKFGDTRPHFESHGPFHFELFASEDNHVLEDYCTAADSCFMKDWAGKACYGNPPYDHGMILRSLQKAIGDFGREPTCTKFLFVLPKWETASRWPLTTQFGIIHEYPAGQQIFLAPLDSCYNTDNLEKCGEDRVWIQETKWPVVVIYQDNQYYSATGHEAPPACQTWAHI
ncbi:hypothetical protein CYMTET_11436 [Cymbomonas tetramitiformis]|uniref:Uncharacterized protein n=1 Tax=Cymbomonas tetramitiformis TaxID=36881 RepID=A0AAE0GMJ8_9CHLO|nr:hypothetical protein CYMTET_11436 [Cymbomonas tetramitiformis]